MILGVNKAQGGAIGAGIVIVAVIGIMVAMASNSAEVNGPQVEIPIQDEPAVSDTVEVNETGSEFVVDEEGKKTYIIDLGDAPDFGEK